MLKNNKGTKQRSLNGGLDDYYTDPEYAFKCCKTVRSKFYRYNINNIVEPSAGDGSFYEGMKLLSRSGKRKLKMYDLAPRRADIIKANFFDVRLTPDTLVLGNPPFGFSANLAVKFFNHAASFRVKLIAFILPKTFKKDSVKNKLNTKYHLLHEEDCPKNCFLLDGAAYDVPCVFQVWGYKKETRVIENWSIENKWIEFTTPEEAEFCIRRVGGRAGQILKGAPTNYATVSTYFCKEKVSGAKKAIANIDFSDIVNSTAGVRSLSKREIHKALHAYYSEV